MDLILQFIDFLKGYPYALLEFVSGFLITLVAIIYRKKTWDYSKPLFVYLLLFFPFELINNFLSSGGNDNHFVYLYFYLLESILLVWYYYENISLKLFKILGTSILLVIVIAISYNIYQNIRLMNDYSGSLQSLGLLIITLICYYDILLTGKIKSLFKSTLFWINSGNLVYFSGKFFIFLFILDVLSRDVNELEGFWKIVTYLLILHRFMLSLGVYCLIYIQNNKKIN
jgi:hypothetical protein